MGKLLRQFSLRDGTDALSRQLGVAIRAGLASASKGQVKFDRLGNVSIEINPVSYSKELTEVESQSQARQDLADTINVETIHVKAAGSGLNGVLTVCTIRDHGLRATNTIPD